MDLPANWKSLVPQNRQYHWVITDAGEDSTPYLEDGAWRVIIWNRREECHYEYHLSGPTVGKIVWAPLPWDNRNGWNFLHISNIEHLVPRSNEHYPPKS